MLKASLQIVPTRRKVEKHLRKRVWLHKLHTEKLRRKRNMYVQG